MARPEGGSGAADRVQVELLRRAGPGRRSALARSLSATVIALARRGIRLRHPERAERENLLEFVAVHYGRELAARVRRDLERRGR